MNIFVVVLKHGLRGKKASRIGLYYNREATPDETMAVERGGHTHTHTLEALALTGEGVCVGPEEQHGGICLVSGKQDRGAGG